MNWQTMTNADVERFARGEPEEKRRLSRQYEPGEMFDPCDCPPESDELPPPRTVAPSSESQPQSEADGTLCSGGVDSGTQRAGRNPRRTEPLADKLDVESNGPEAQATGSQLLK